MLIKIDNERFINSDHIVMIVPCMPEETANIYLLEGHCLEVPLSIASYITGTLETNDTYTEEKPPELSLESQIAQFLRNQAAGQAFEHICRNFPDRQTISITAALKQLLTSNVIRNLGDTDSPLYYHASNSIFTGAAEQF